MCPLVIAHRTAPRHAPENSIEGIRRAAQLGADGVEVDVQRTLDRVPVLMHDRTLWRTARVPVPARLLPYCLVRRLRLKGSDEPVPTLAQALDALPSSLLIAIELKHASAVGPTLAEVRRRALEPRTLIWSEHGAALRYTVGHAPEIEAALLRDTRSPRGLLRFLDEAVRLGARAISAHWRAITPAFVDQAHRRGLTVYSFAPTVQASLDHARAGVDGLITDFPDDLRAALRQSGTPRSS